MKTPYKTLYKTLVLSISAASTALGMTAQEVADSAKVTSDAAVIQAVGATGDTTLVNLPFRKTEKRDLMGGVSTVNVQELQNKNYMTYSLDNMQSLVSGWTGELWHQGEALILVDGVPRDASNVHPDEIADITFLKSAQAVVLYGSRASNGAVLITTKRGTKDGLHVTVDGNATCYVPKRYPKYLGSEQYMTLYNEARINDGLEPVYSAEDIYNYSTLSNLYRYPEINFFSEDYVKKNYWRYDANAQFEGGGKFAHFYTYIGFYHVGDLINFGEGKHNHSNRLSIRGNIDLMFSDSMTGWVDASATFYDNRSDLSDFWNQSGIQRPTSQYALVPLIPIDAIDPNDEASQILVNNSSHLIDGKYLLGGTQNQQTNAFAAMYAAGYNKYTSRQMQVDAGINIKLNKILEGLSFKAHFATDYATSYNTSINNEYSTYEATWANYNGQDVITGLTKYGTDKSTGTQNMSGSYTRQIVLFNAQFDYDRSFGQHNVNATLLGNGYQQTVTGNYHNTTNANLGLQATYNFAHTYYADLSMAMVHSSKLAPGHRNAFSPVGTIAWRLSNEPWLRDHTWIEDLKLTASYGVIHQDVDISDYYMYDEVFTASGTWWGWSESASLKQTTLSTRGANTDLSFVKRKEWRVGLEAQLWKGLINLEANYFDISTNDQIIIPETLYPSYFAAWGTSFKAYTNYNNQSRRGVDFSVTAFKRFGEVDVKLGFVGMYYWSKNDRISENNEYDWLNSTGTAIETIRGYHCLGFFQSEEEIANSAVINSNTKPGDLKYEDKNGDGIIDYQDMVVLGKWQAPFVGGVNLTVGWKGFTLYAAGTFNTGAKSIRSNALTWVYGDGKYTDMQLNRWTPETAATATYPRLTTLSGDLNFVASNFWLFDPSAFYLSRLQLTYDFPSSIFRHCFIKGVQVYFLGTDLLTISKERKYLETNIGFPQCRGYNFGVKVNI